MTKTSRGAETPEMFKEIGARIKQWRTEQRKQRQEDLAKELGVVGNAVSLWERGGRMTQDNIIGLVLKCKISADWLLLGERTWEGSVFRALAKLPEEEREHLKDVIAKLLKLDVQKANGHDFS